MEDKRRRIRPVYVLFVCVCIYIYAQYYTRYGIYLYGFRTRKHDGRGGGVIISLWFMEADARTSAALSSRRVPVPLDRDLNFPPAADGRAKWILKTF